MKPDFARDITAVGTPDNITTVATLYKIATVSNLFASCQYTGQYLQIFQKYDTHILICIMVNI